MHSSCALALMLIMSLAFGIKSFRIHHKGHRSEGKSSSQECDANHGAQQRCCGQEGTGHIERMCPSDRPFCHDFRHNVQWGVCSEDEPNYQYRSPVPHSGACDWGLEQAGITASCLTCNSYYDGRPELGNDYQGKCEYVPAENKCYPAFWVKETGMTKETDCRCTTDESCGEGRACDDGVCKSTCAGFTCPAGKLLKEDAANILGQGRSEALCCECTTDESCGSGHICDAEKKCKTTCSGFSCPAGSFLKENADSIIGQGHDHVTCCVCQTDESCLTVGGVEARCDSGTCKARDFGYHWGWVNFAEHYGGMGGGATYIEPKVMPDHKLPLIMNLHGSGRRAMNLQGVMYPKKREHQAKILVPQTSGHWQCHEMIGAIDHLLATDDSLDPDRIYVTGFSLGGLGTWNFARCYPDRAAAVVPVAFRANQDRLASLVNLPIWAIAGWRDRRRARSVSSMVGALRNFGSTSVRETITGDRHMGTSHSAWGIHGLVDWLFQQSRKTHTNITIPGPDEHRSAVPNGGACDWGLQNEGVDASCHTCNLYYDGRGENFFTQWCEYVPSKNLCFPAGWAKQEGYRTETDCPDGVDHDNGKEEDMDTNI